MPLKRSILSAAAAAATAAASAPALAHVGVGGTSGFAAGLAHPLGGLDHLLAMIAVGLLASAMPGRGLLLVPAGFLAALAAGGALGAAGVGLPAVEQGILGSMIILGGVVALGRRLPLAAALGLVAVFGIVHGHAHGAEMPSAVSGLAYGLGFLLASALLHAAGIAAGLAAHGAPERRGPMAVQLGGAAVAVAGAAIAVF